MPQQAKYVPKHRAPGRHKAVRPTAGKAVRATVLLTGVAAATTGAAVSGGVLSASTVVPPALADDAVASSTLTAADLQRRSERSPVSRSDRRGSVDPAKASALSVSSGQAVTREQKLSAGDPRDIARALLPLYGFDDSQFSCLDSLYVSESNWRVDADNPTSSAYGIPQALTQTHDLPAGYMTSAEVQIRWGLDYIQDRYGTPCNAWSFKRSHNWY